MVDQFIKKRHLKFIYSGSTVCNEVIQDTADIGRNDLQLC